MKIYMIGGTDSHVKCGVKDYTLELQRYLEQENVDIVQINDKSDTATISDWQSIFAYHKLAVELKKINARILHVEYPAKAYGKSIGVNFLPSVVGEYTIAVKVYTVIKNILVAIYAAVTPRLATMMSETAESQYKKLNTTIWCYLSLILIPAGFGLTAVSKDVMLLVGGEEIATTSFSLQILSISLIFAIYGGLITSVYNITQGREKENLMATTVSAIINCGLNLYMIPKYSLYGAAFTTLLSELFVFVFCTLRAPNKKRFFDVDEIKNSILYAVVGSILVLLTTKVVYMLVECSALLRLIIAVALSAVVYITYLIIFKNKYTIDIVRNIMVKIKKKY